MMRGSELTQAAQMVSANLSLARQTALSSGHSVQVRLYQFSDPSMPERGFGQSVRWKIPRHAEFSDCRFRHHRRWQIQTLPSMTVIVTPVRESSTLSSIISQATVGTVSPCAGLRHYAWVSVDPIPITTPSSSAFNPTVPRFQLQQRLVSHRGEFERSVDTPGLPANFVTIQLNC